MAKLWDAGRHIAGRCADLGLFVRAYIRVGHVDLRLRAYGFQGVMQRVERRIVSEGTTVHARDVRRARRYARRIETAARLHFVRARCLHRSLALHEWLREEGLPSELRIGVRKQGGELKAHAWVELGQHVVTEAAVIGFAPLGRAAIEGDASDSGLRWACQPVDR